MKGDDIMVKAVYAFKNTNIKDSSSGAAFPTIIEVLKNQHKDVTEFAVYGAAFNDDCSVSHRRVVNEDEFIQFRGSKYVQSNLGDSLQRIVDDLQRGNAVLFSGTPCQVYAVGQYVRKKGIDDSRLYLVDIVCHGTPQAQLWSDFVRWLEKKYGSQIAEFSFRYQKARWKYYPVMARFQNGKKVVNSHSARLFTTLFTKNLSMRSSCFSCKFSNTERPSDLTIGDFWGIKECIPKFPYKNEVSQILVNTEKGQCIADALRLLADGEGIIIQECKTNRYLKFQHNLNRPTSKPADYDQFWADYKSHGLEYILNSYAGNNVKGKCDHIITRFLNETKIASVLRRIK